MSCTARCKSQSTRTCTDLYKYSYVGTVAACCAKAQGQSQARDQFSVPYLGMQHPRAPWTGRRSFRSSTETRQERYPCTEVFMAACPNPHAWGKWSWSCLIQAPAQHKVKAMQGGAPSVKKGGGHEAEPSSPTCNQLKINSTKLQLLRTLQDRALYKHLTKSSPDKKKNGKESMGTVGLSVY